MVRGDDAVGYIRAGRGGAFSTEDGAKTVHRCECLGTTLRVRKHKNTHRHAYAHMTTELLKFMMILPLSNLTPPENLVTLTFSGLTSHLSAVK